jgi:ABC-2 type transport system permease protein
MFKALLLKEIKLILRDKYALLVLFLMPIIFVLIMSFSLQEVFENNEKTTLKIFAMVDEKVNEQWANNFLTLQGFDIKLIKKETLDKVKKNILKGVRFALIKITNNNPPSIEIYYSPSAPNYVRSLLTLNLTLTLTKLNNKSSLKTKNDFLIVKKILHNTTNKKPSSVQQSVPAWLIFAMFFIIIPFSATLLIELNNGTLERLNTFPISKQWILLGKLLPYLLVNQIQAILMFLTGIFLVPSLGGEALILGNNFWLLLPVSLSLSLMAISFALLIAVMVKTHEQASSIGGISNLLMGAIGGVMVPVFIMPEKMQFLASFSPMNWGLEAFLNILLRQGDFQSVLPYITKLTLLAFLLFMIAYQLLQKRLLKV